MKLPLFLFLSRRAVALCVGWVLLLMLSHAQAGSKLTAEWTYDAAKYKITEFILYDGEKEVARVAGDKTSLELTGVEPGLHSYTMVAKNEYATSPPSKRLDITVPPAPGLQIKIIWEFDGSSPAQTSQKRKQK